MRALRRLARTVISVGVATALAMMLVTALVRSDAAAAACALTILSCGCTINAPGTYTLAGPSPMNSTGTCIDITASNVTLTGGQVLKGPGASTATFGVHIEPSANKVFLTDLEVEDFGAGIRVDGRNTSTDLVITTGNNKGTVVNGANAMLLEQVSELDNIVGIQINPSATDFVGLVLEAVDAIGAGIKLNGVSGAFIDDVLAEGNGTFGIWLQSASNNDIDGFVSESNGVAGVYLGCNAAGPNGTACPSGVASSNGNTLIGSVYGSKNSVVSNTGTPLNQRFGMAVGLGNLHNHFLAITGAGNVDEDALDENPNCSNNRWFADTFTKSNPAKNTTFFCLN
jgi:hypothetical protein